MRLIIQSGPLAGQVVDLVKDSITIGRNSDNDVVIADNVVSRRHCQIQRTPNGWMITDLGSANGTYVNGQRITTPTLLRPGDSIRIGQTNLQVEASTEPPTLPSTPPVAAQVPQASPMPAQGNSNVWLWVGLGVLFIVLLGASVLAVVFLTLPKPTPVVTIPSPTTGLILLPTAASTPSVPIVLPVVGTPSPSSTVVATLPPGGERTITPIPTIAPTVTPIKVFPIPKLEKPNNGEKITDSLQVEFSWSTAGVLRAQDAYRFEISLHPQDFGPANIVCTIYTRETAIAVVNKEPRCNDKWQFNPNYHYYWRVQVVAPDGKGGFEPQHGGEPAVVNDFFWAP